MIEILIWSILVILYLIPTQYVVIDCILERKYSKINNSKLMDIMRLLLSVVPLFNYILMVYLDVTYRYKLMSGRNDVVFCGNCSIYTRRFYLINKEPTWKINKWDADEYINNTDKANCPFCNSNKLLDVKHLNVKELPFGEYVPYFKGLFSELFKFKTKQYKLDKLEVDRLTLQNTLNLIQQQSDAMDRLLEKEKLNN